MNLASYYPEDGLGCLDTPLIEEPGPILLGQEIWPPGACIWLTAHRDVDPESKEYNLVSPESVSHNST